MVGHRKKGRGTVTTSAGRLRVAPQPRNGRALKVLHLIDSLGPGGAERLMIGLLPQLERHDVAATVVALQEREGNPVAADLAAVGYPVTTMGIARLRQRGALAQVAEVIRAAEPAVLHTQLEFSNILGSIGAHRLGVPAIATIHTLDRPRAWSREAARFRLMAWTLRHRADRVVAVSESARRHVLAKAGLRRKQTTTIHNGIDLSAFAAPAPERRAEYRSRWGVSRDALIVTTVAVLRPEKGVADMLDALPRLLTRRPDLVYVIIGDGPARRALEERAAGLGVSGSVRFAGFSGDVAGCLAAADYFVLPSHTEALPTVVIEAMAAGLPIVAAAVGGVPELLGPDAAGMLVAPHSPDHLADALTRLLTSPRQAAAMGRAARRSATKRFDIERQASRLADEYRVLAARRERP